METTQVVVIGAGPSGLAVGASLQQRRIDFVILEKEHQVGSSWRRHYERLHLHTIKSRLRCLFGVSIAITRVTFQITCCSLP